MAADGMFKRRRAGGLVLELAAIVVVLGSAAVAIYFGFRSPPIHDVRPLGGRNVDVSHAPGAQYEVSVAADPADPHVLLAASIDSTVDARVYESTDGGATWTSVAATPFQRGPCGLSHPAVAIGPRHLQVFASLVSPVCQPPDPRLTVAVRRGPAGSWSLRRLAPPRGFVFDLRPSVAVDARGWIYVVWSRLIGEISSHEVVLFSRSEDGGTSWSTPTRIGRYRGVYSVELAAGSAGEVYLAVADGERRELDLLRSTNGGTTWPDRRRLARLAERYGAGCSAGTIVVRAQPQHCVGPSPSVALAPGAVDVVYSEPGLRQVQTIYVASTDRRLRTVARPHRISPADARRSDEFLPVAAFDTSTGDLWTCYYDTLGDPTRKSAWFTCTRSSDGGRRWSQPVHAASHRSDETQTASDFLGYGDTEGLVAVGGVAHPLWTDNRDALASNEEIYTAAIHANRLRR